MERGLSLKYLRITNEVWTAEAVAKEVHALRSSDEDADLVEEADADRANHLSLQPLYAKPPPVWLHPAFAAEFGDSFIGGTRLEHGAMHISLEVVCLALQAMLKPGGTAATCLPNRERAALNSACALLLDAKKLAHKLQYALEGDGQERLFLGAVVEEIEELEPGASMLVPIHLGGVPLLLVIARGLDDEVESCTLTVVSCSVSGVAHHRAAAAPPKIKYETCLSLRKISLSRLLDGAFWSVLWFSVQGSSDDPRVRYSPITMLYQILLSFLAEDSLEGAMARSEEDKVAAMGEVAAGEPEEEESREATGGGGTGGGKGGGGGSKCVTASEGTKAATPAAEQLHTLRRSESAHYGVIRHALSFLLRSYGVGVPQAKHVSLLLRLQMLRLAKHDIQFVKSVSAAERTLLGIATRQLAYKASKLGHREGSPLDAASLASIRGEAEQLEQALLDVPGALPGHTPPPPPLVLSAADEPLLRPSLPTLIGPGVLLPPELVKAAGEGAMRSLPTDAMLDGIEVVGLYFSASWCPPCQQTTPLIGEAYRLLKGRGKALEVVFVSLDNSEEEYDAYRAKMPFPALPFGGKRPAGLSELFEIRGIPSLVLLDREGRLISTDGVRLLRKHARAFPWSVKPPPQTPHLRPLFERLMRREPVDTGPPFDLPRYKPLDFLNQPVAVTTFAEAVSVLRECDLLCTTTAVQSHSVLNTAFLKVALIQHTFTSLLPLPRPRKLEGTPGPAEEEEEHAARGARGASPPPRSVRSSESGGGRGNCIWRTPMLYDEQLGLLLLLQRICEHFAASVLSLDHTRSIDGVRMVVPACIAAVADCVMRQIATDKPSRVCVHLRGEGTKRATGFALGSAALMAQSATIPVHTPELNTARTMALDYFEAQESLPKVFAWERSEVLDKPTSRWMQLVAHDLAFPTDPTNTAAYIWDAGALMIKNFPELRCFRDVAYYFKFFLNPAIAMFPPKRPWTQRHAELTFVFKAPLFFTIAFADTVLAARPRPKKGETAPAHRFPSYADPSEWTKPVAVEGEDDVLHMWELPDFGQLDVASSRALGQHDSELLLSYLTVPYLRIPLVVSFFASDDRIHSLQVAKLQKLLDATLFEPGNHLPASSAGLEPVDVPTSAPTLLGTAHHLLLNELCRSPATLLDGINRLARQAVDLDTGTFEASTTTIILYVVRLCARVDSYVSFVLSYHDGTHDSIRGQPFRQLDLAPGAADKLREAQAELRKVLWGDLRRMLHRWYNKLVRQNSEVR